MTLDTLRERLAYWQRVLRLQDWDIVVKYASRQAIDEVGGSPFATAWANFHREYRKAVVWLLAPAEFPHVVDASDRAFADAFGYDVEQTLLHELLHLVVHEAASKPDVEYAVEMLANAFVRLERRGHTTYVLDVSTFAQPDQFIDVPKRSA